MRSLDQAAAAAGREALVVTGTEEGAALGSRSAVVYGLRSIMVAPLEIDDRLVGVGVPRHPPQPSRRGALLRQAERS